MGTYGLRLGRVLGGLALAALAATFAVLLWGPVLLAGLALIVVAGIGAVLRDLWLGRRGVRHRRDAGTIEIDVEVERAETVRTTVPGPRRPVHGHWVDAPPPGSGAGDRR
jgi:hypothetical protein